MASVEPLDSQKCLLCDTFLLARDQVVTTAGGLQIHERCQTVRTLTRCNAMVENKSMTTVYRIDTYPGAGNAHGIGSRQENWVLRLDRTFSLEEEARTYCREKNRTSSTMVNFMATLGSDEERAAFVNEFCFGTNAAYVVERRYFVGDKETIEKLVKESLTRMGIVRLC